MVIRRREKRRTDVTEAEELELVLGPAPEGSVFRSAADRIAARVAFGTVLEGRDEIDEWQAQGRVEVEKSRRERLVNGGESYAEQASREAAIAVLRGLRTDA